MPAILSKRERKASREAVSQALEDPFTSGYVHRTLEEGEEPKQALFRTPSRQHR